MVVIFKTIVKRGLLACAVVSLLSLAVPSVRAEEADVADLFSIFEPKNEGKIGAQQHPRIVAQYGGEYIREGLNDYVLDIVLRIASVTEQKGEPWRATILNSPVVNAFALPGGYVYVTRGLLALANNEAEVAGVLAHEVGHVIARHGVQRQGRATGIGLLGAIAGILTQSSDVFKLGQTIGGAYIAGYSRDQEYEADQLGVKYLELAGYPPEAMGDFLARLDAHSTYAAKIAVKDGKSGQFDFFASHPQTDDRIAKAKESARRIKDDLDRKYGRELYLQSINGMLYGDDIKEGVIQGRWFLHPELRFKFQAPKGYQLINSSRAVYAMNGEGGRMVFDMDPKGLRGLPVDQYVRKVWLQKVKPASVDVIQVGGAQAARARFAVNKNGKELFVTGVVINFGYDRVVRFVYENTHSGQALEESYAESYESFVPLAYDEAAAIKPIRLVIDTVKEDEELKDLYEGMAEAGPAQDLFLLLNPTLEETKPQAGRQYKRLEYGSETRG